jgi:DNA ligase-1
MKPFAALFAALDHTTSTNLKVDAMIDYFRQAPAADAAWAVFFLTGRRLKRVAAGRAIAEWTLAATGLPEWLLTESYAIVGDGAETSTLLLDQLPPLEGESVSLAEWVEQRIMPLREMEVDRQRRAVLGWVATLTRWQRFTLLKILTGELRLGVSQTLVVRALAEASAIAPATMAARLMGEWTPSASWFAEVSDPAATDTDLTRPYPFCLASSIEGSPDAGHIAERLGDRADWQVEWKWDGIRAQLVRRAGQSHLWSRGEELITRQFPEIVAAAGALGDGVVLDGEILAYRDDRPLPFSALQQRLGRERHVSRAARDVPVVFMAYDVLEHRGEDIRERPLRVRRAVLESIVEAVQIMTPPTAAVGDTAPLLPFDLPATATAARSPWQLSPVLDAVTWQALVDLRDDARLRGVEGLMIKRRSSAYLVGRKRGEWWKWKIDPHTIDAVLIYAQPGSGKRASLLSDYTFGLWDNGQLVPVAKAYSGLTNEEIGEVDRWIRRHTIERFGPVRHVEPVQVFELGFEAIAASSRHRSGVAVRFPRMLRWRKDKMASEADTLESLKAMIGA